MTEWSRERIDLVRRTVCPRGITDDEFALFVEQCKRSGLDPLLKEAYCVPRRQNVGTRERPNWIEKHEFQPAETGMLARAEREADYKGITASAVYECDSIEIDAGAGLVTHRYTPGKKRGQLIGAWARVARDGKSPTVVWLDLAGYVQTSPLWGKIPATVIEKCARVAALRKAYPSAFGGLYIREELPEGDETQAPAALPASTGIRETIQPKVSRTEALKAQIKDKLGVTDAQVVEAPRPTEPTPITRVAEMAKARGLIGGPSIANAIKDATGKAKREDLTDEDVAKFSAWCDRNLGPAKEPESEREALQDAALMS